MSGSERATGGVVVLLTTVGREEDARRLARLLVEERLAACASILPPVLSIYRWRGSVSEEPEHVLLIKTARAAAAAASERLIQEHPYEVPELLEIDADRVSAPYLDWIIETTRREVDG